MPFTKGYTPWNKNKKLSKETRLKMRNSTLGFKHSTEAKEKCRLSKLGNKNPNFGKITSKKTKRKLSKANKGRKISEDHRKKLHEIIKQRAVFLRGKTLEQVYGDKKGKEIRKKLSSACSKEKNGNWKNGISTENHIVRGSKRMRSWRRSIFERDNWVCQKCNKRSSIILNAHHIKSFSKFPELRFKINNGITFCKECHEEFHKLYGKGNVGIIELVNFIIMNKKMNEDKITEILEGLEIPEDKIVQIVNQISEQPKSEDSTDIIADDFLESQIEREKDPLKKAALIAGEISKSFDE